MIVISNACVVNSDIVMSLYLMGISEGQSPVGNF